MDSPCRSGPSELLQHSLLTFVLRVYAMTTGQTYRLTENQGVKVFLRTGSCWTVKLFVGVTPLRESDINEPQSILWSKLAWMPSIVSILSNHSSFVTNCLGNPGLYLICARDSWFSQKNIVLYRKIKLVVSTKSLKIRWRPDVRTKNQNPKNYLYHIYP